MCDIFGDQIFRYVNKVTDIVHLSCIEMGGIPIEYDGKGFLLLFKSSHVLQSVVLHQRKSTRKMTTKKTVKSHKINHVNNNVGHNKDNNVNVNNKNNPNNNKNNNLS